MRSGMKSKSVVLIGMAGVGKSTIGMALSEALGFDFVDLDEYILENDGKTIQGIIDDEGEEALLRLEKRRMSEVDLTHKVVAPGGSIIYHPDLMAYLRQHSTIIHLDDSFERIEARLANASTRGIVGLKNKSLRQVYDERRRLHSRYANMTIDCQNRPSNQVVREILRHLCGPPGKP